MTGVQTCALPIYPDFAGSAIDEFDGASGKVWVLEEGVLRKKTLSFGARSENALYEVTGGLPEGAAIVASRGPGLKEGRSASALPVKP